LAVRIQQSHLRGEVFDHVRSEQHLTDLHRLYLQVAAVLHDVGLFVNSRSRRHTSHPSISGIITSSSTRSGGCAWASRNDTNTKPRRFGVAFGCNCRACLVQRHTQVQVGGNQMAPRQSCLRLPYRACQRRVPSGDKARLLGGDSYQHIDAGSQYHAYSGKGGNRQSEAPL
jgi:hypothetical protein